MDRRTLLGAAAAAFGLVACAPDAPAQTTPAPAPDPENILVLQLPAGEVRIQLLPELAPQHVERIKTLTRRGFYDNTPFHRVIEGFMAQGGDPTGTGTGGSPLPDLPAEFSPPSRARFLRGTVGAARTQNPNSANSQFFIMFAPTPSLDGQYTIWGRVISGMDAVDRLKRGVGQSGQVPAPADRIRTARIAADIR
ncbi:peptidylprolyl isomerase [Roseomonas rosulenta]|uniref:peptidylprolyl isomerase n=1 Tax=Roseomonas rosulenta TaxID=2748667 RepID=UPI0018E01547|nr:peptidylprolyl isomerase [Roseomonas rosulenta]